MDFVSVVDLDGLSFDELSAFQGVHGVAGEVSGVVDLHLDAEVAGAEAGIGGSDVDDGERDDFVGGEIVGGRNGRRNRD